MCPTSIFSAAAATSASVHQPSTRLGGNLQACRSHIRRTLKLSARHKQVATVA
jgi:hypothetical protein